MQFLRQSTANQAVLLGPFVDDTDGATAETGLTINASDIRLSANGGNMAAKNSGGGTHDENGFYAVTFDATDTATVGRLQVSVKVAGALAVWAEFQVLEEAVYDDLFAASAPGIPTAAEVVNEWESQSQADPTGFHVNVQEIRNTTQSAADLYLVMLSFFQLALRSDAAIATDKAAFLTILNANEGSGVGDYSSQTDAQEAVRDHIGNGSNLTEAGGTGDHLTAIPWNAAWDAEVQSEVNDGLTAFWTSPATLVDLIMDEDITGANHNVNGSLAKFVREGAEGVGLTGTLQAATASTAQLASGAFPAGAGDNYFRGERISIIEGTGAPQSRLISGGTASTDTVTLAHDWDINPDSSSVYSITGAEVDVRAVAEQPVAATATVDFDDLAAILLDTAEIGTAGAGLTNINLPDQTMNITGNITGNLSGSVGSVTGAVGSVTGNVGGNVVGSVGSISGVTFPTNFASMVITAGGAVDALVQGFMDTLLTETTAGRIAGNFDVFFENADAATTQTVDDVGGGGNVTVGDITSAALAKFMTVDTGETVGVAGSVAKIAQGSAGGNVTVEAFTGTAEVQISAMANTGRD